MKLSLNWLKKYLNISETPEKIAEKLTLIGLEVEGIDKVESIRGGLKGVVIGQVLTCEKHPDADKLSLTTVDIGEGDPLPIVCGAPNVAAGQKVLIATIGTTLYDAEGNPWIIKKGKIRGADSYGMICAEDELGLGTSHDGIMVLPETAALGMQAAEYFNIEDDFVFEIGLTPNRSDATSQLGVARDLLAYMRVHDKYTDEIIEPDVSGFVTEKTSLNIDVDSVDARLCVRYTGMTITNVTIKESPDWLKKLLISIGVKPINNIVDITNFILNELGQPLHAFDAEKIGNNKIRVQNLAEGTLFKTLDGIERKLSSEDIIVTDINNNGLCIGGIYGGLGSGVNESTKHVFIEAACFNSTRIRRTSTRHNLRTDAAKIFEKGSDPNITEFAIKRAAALIQSLAGGEISNKIVDIYPHPIKPTEIRLRYQVINDLIGNHIDTDTVHDILLAMDMEITPIDHESIIVKVPTNKVDVTRDVDLVEEILRIYGLNNVDTPDKIRSTISYSQQPDKHKVKETIGNLLADSGFNEMMGLSLIESSYYEKLGFDPANFVYINNTSNIHLNIMRPDMLISGLVSISYNINRQQSNLNLFEFGKSYLKNEEEFKEKEALTLFLAGKKTEESWLTSTKSDKTIYDLKKIVFSILKRCGVTNYQVSELENDDKLAYGLRIHKGPQTIVEFGEIQKRILSEMGIKTTLFYAEVSISELFKNMAKSKIHVNEISRFPSVRRDIALVIDKEVKFGDIESIARKIDKKILKQINLFDVFSDESKLGEGKKSYAVSFVFEDLEKTLKDQEIEGIMQRLTTTLEKETGAFIRK
jgi:phenylalanyl-tRNA synthetase beta chain